MQRDGQEFKNDHELRFSREQGFFDKSHGVRLAIAAVFALALFAFLHFREVRVEIPELGTVASRYIVAQIDFDFFDQDATVIMKEEAVRDIGKVYLISDKDVHNRRQEFDNLVLNDQGWRQQLPKTTYEELYQGAELLEKTLQQLRFTDPRTLRKMKSVDLPRANFILFTPGAIDEPLMLPQSVWELSRERIKGKDNISPEAAQHILDFFKGKEWRLEEDPATVAALRSKVAATVRDKYTSVTAGSRIIDQGEKVTNRHIAQLTAMKKALSDERNLWSAMTIAGSALLALLLTAICAVYLYYNHPLVLLSNRKLFLLVTVTLLTMVLAKVVELVVLNSHNALFSMVRYPVMVPFAAIILCSLLNPSVATFVAGFLTLVLIITLTFDQTGFMLLNVAAAMVAIMTTRSLRRRKEIFIICGKAWLVCLVVLFSLHLYQGSLGSFALPGDIISTGFFLLVTGVLVVGLLPLLESGFGIMTDVSLMEYMDPNSDLLRRLSVEAPGTYQHSVLVGNLAEAAALAIGANGLFCRVSTLYHDIGKMATPQYFAENQQGGMNIHQLLTPKESAHVIISHISEGVAMARKAGLPEQFIDIIKEHHGTQLVYFFYRKELERCGGDEGKVDREEFRYSGPTPRSKESAIIMLADSVEAASRSLEAVTEESLTALANRLIKEKIEDGQFDHCLLTFEELAIVKKTLIKNLVAFGHSRVKYPSRISKGAEDA